MPSAANRALYPLSRINGEPALIKERIAEYAEAGVEHIVLDMATLSHKNFLRTLETFSAHIKE